MKPSLLSVALSAALSVPVLATAGFQSDLVDQQAAPAPASSSAAVEELESIHVTGENMSSGSQALSLAERRYAGGVTEVLGADAMSQAGDSDAGAALKRVTGLSLVDSQYIYVRGLGERYSSVLLNGARLPSPDPTRRVVPLDLFPTAVLDSVVVSKSAAADLPGHFGGGAVLLRTRRYPQRFTAQVEVGGKFDGSATGKTGLVYDGGARDWTGFDNDARSLPGVLQTTASGRPIRPQSPLEPDGMTAAELEQLGEQVAAGSVYRVDQGRLDPGMGVSGSIGHSLDLGGGKTFGFLAALRYSTEWDHREEQRNSYAASASGLQLADSMAVEQTSQQIEASGFVSAGLDLGTEHRFGLTHMLLRQTEDVVKRSRGQTENQMLERHQLRWVENELRSTQLAGSHALPRYAMLDWQFTEAAAFRDEPNTRRWRRDDDDRNGSYEFSDRTDSNAQTTAHLEDGIRDWSVKFSMPFDFSDNVSAHLEVGHASLHHDRVAGLRSFSFDGRVDESLLPLPQEIVLTPDHIAPDGLMLEETTLPTDNYVATQDVDSWYLKGDFSLFMDWRLVAGLRHEANNQQVITSDLTRPDAPPIIAGIDQSELLPSLALSWMADDHNQLRLAYAETVSRPDFRELSPAPFLDPLLDLVTLGNPDLVTTSIRHLDFRWEHYFSDSDSLALGLFHKSIDNPIEKTFSAGGSTQFVNLRNALSAEVYGIELDARRSLAALNSASWLPALPLDWRHFHIGANYSRMQSSVELDPRATTQTTTGDRPLQGASPYTANLRLGYQSADGNSNWSVLYNLFGERIARAGVAGQPDVYEQPFPQLDFVYRHALGKHAEIKLALGNLLDPEVEFRQGGKLTRSYHKGRTLELDFGVRF